MPKIEKYLEYPQDTRWATDEEIMSPISSSKVTIANPPFVTAGLILKSDGKTVYVDGLDHHSMIIGSTGSGKSRLLCMPMIGIMANAGESFIATDPKGELFQMTSGFAKNQGYQVVVLNFRDVSCGDMWNPLLIPYELYQKGEKDQALSLLNDFVMTLTAAECGNQDRFWTQMAQSLILANILLLFETGKQEEINMHSLSRLCLDYGRPRNQNAVYQLLDYMNPDSIAGMNYTGVCVDAEKTQSSIMSVVHSVLRVFNTQEGLLRMMAGNTFDMRSFGRKKTAVYLIIPDEKSTFHFLVSTFTKQCYEMLISEAHREETMRLPVRVNFMLDEFANLPSIPDMPNMISAARSRNIRFHLVIQSMNQLYSKYGHDSDTISSNCENWVYLNSKEYDYLEEISKRCGNLLDNRNQLRPLITPSRLQHLDKERGEALIFHGRHYPYITYLADISRYDFQVCTPVELKREKRKPVSVFHADEILQELKTGKRAPLFYESEDESGECGFDEEGRDEDYFPGVVPPSLAETLLEELCAERRQKQQAEIPGLQMLCYLLSSQRKMKKISEMGLAEKERYEAEDICRKTELAACCTLLAGKSFKKGETEEYQSSQDETEEY
ncbi:MAG: type IV secretory system conjugative DNA transfer family protein, partial [Lachnospiraceae bacterium]|nr:type IV secretory system conjugative DNA transfer family protein [Lachnospiraceae bacterium]